MPPKSPPLRMTLDEVMEALAANGTAQNVKIYRRHGGIDPMFGVSSAFLKDLAKKIKTDHALAAALWATGNFDAMNLAPMIADPAAITDAEADRWLLRVRCYPAAYALASVVAPSPVGLSRARAWMADPAEYSRTTGYDTLCVMLRDKAALDDAWLAEVVATIEAEIGGSANRARHAMNMALIAIGGNREPLRDAVLAAAARIGPVKVDHGETSCVTPLIAPYIAKMAARQKA